MTRSTRTSAATAELVLLNETLRDYGQAAAVSRDLLRRYAMLAIDDN